MHGGLRPRRDAAAVPNVPAPRAAELLLLAGVLQEQLGTGSSRRTAADEQTEHKARHKAQTGHNPFPTYAFSGSLRPVYPLSPRRAVPAHIALPDYARDGIPRSEQGFQSRKRFTVLDAQGQAAMRKVCRLAREVLDTVARAVRPGVTTDQLDDVCHQACIEREVSGARA